VNERSTLLSDTDDDAARVQVERWRALSVAERMAIVGQLNARSRAMAEVRLRAWYPDDGPRGRPHTTRLTSLPGT
jgi:hypothetical protein